MISLPPFPWDRLAAYKATAEAHADGVVDLSVGTPVDPVPQVVQNALTNASDWPGYPATAGTSALQDAISAWVRRHCGVTGDFGVLPTVGSKELVAGLGQQLGIGAGDAIAFPALSYPTYEIGIQLAGAQPLRMDDEAFAGDPRLRMIWVNYPANPTGEICEIDQLKALVEWARAENVIVASDECYLKLAWDRTQVSILDPRVCGPEPTGVLAVHSLSKRSNLAGYRAGFVAGDQRIVDELLAVRKHAGLIVPGPVQNAMTAALNDETHADLQRERYRARRDLLIPALREAGFRIDDSHAGLYLWATRGQNCWDTVAALADMGIVVAPGEFYGPSGMQHVRIALTAATERINSGCARLAAIS